MVSPQITKTVTVRVLVADQHPVIRIGVENLLQAEAGIRVVGEAGDSNEVITRTLELCPDILLLALNLPGLEAMRAVLNASPKTRTILLANIISKQEILKALQLGASGLVSKDALMDNLTAAIRAVSAGKCWIGDRRAISMASALPAVTQEQPPAVEKKFTGLTPRELEVVGCIIKGLSNRDIAQKFELSEETIKRHLSNIFEKTGVSTRLELALFAIQHQLVASHS